MRNRLACFAHKFFVVYKTQALKWYLLVVRSCSIYTAKTIAGLKRENVKKSTKTFDHKLKYYLIFKRKTSRYCKVLGMTSLSYGEKDHCISFIRTHKHIMKFYVCRKHSMKFYAHHENFTYIMKILRISWKRISKHIMKFYAYRKQRNHVQESFHRTSKQIALGTRSLSYLIASTNNFYRFWSIHTYLNRSFCVCGESAI